MSTSIDLNPFPLGAIAPTSGTPLNVMSTVGAIAVVGTVTATPALGGTLTDATPYYYKVTALNATGETTGSPEATATTASPNLSIALSWTAITGATSYRVYRGTAPSGESVYFSTGTNSFTDVGAAGTAGTVPTTNTTGGTLTQKTAKRLQFYAATGNSGLVYVGRSSLNRTTFDGVLLVIAKGETKELLHNEASSNILDLNKFFVDVDTTGDKAVASVLFA